MIWTHSGQPSCHKQRENTSKRNETCVHQTEGCDVTRGSARGRSQEQARLATGGQSKGKCWKVMHNAEEQSGSEQWESGSYVLEITTAAT